MTRRVRISSLNDKESSRSGHAGNGGPSRRSSKNEATRFTTRSNGHIMATAARHGAARRRRPNRGATPCSRGRRACSRTASRPRRGHERASERFDSIPRVARGGAPARDRLFLLPRARPFLPGGCDAPALLPNARHTVLLSTCAVLGANRPACASPTLCFAAGVLCCVVLCRVVSCGVVSCRALSPSSPASRSCDLFRPSSLSRRRALPRQASSICEAVKASGDGVRLPGENCAKIGAEVGR